VGLFDFVKKLFGGSDAGTVCPSCGTPYRDGARYCGQCNHPRGVPTSRPTIPPPVVRQPKVQNLTGLDAQKFEPMTTADAKATIKEAGTLRSAFLDPLTVIPDPTLPRIQIIDRTMVGLGLISPEELTHIHEVGLQYAEMKGDLSVARAAGERAVRLSREERAARKQQKIEEAQRRRKARAEAIARRRATDIVFLGRGVSRGLADRRANVERLKANDLPIISSPAELSVAMNIPIPRLRFLAFHSDAPQRVHYVTFTVPKKSGGTRLLSAPHQSLATAQQWILENILSKVSPHDAAHGFVPGRSTLTNAEPHVGADTVVNVDLKDFFPTITFARVLGVFRALGYSPAIATILALLCTEAPRRPMTYDGQTYYAATGPRALPQGACTSPALSNLVARRLDRRMLGIAQKLGWTYTRYADDLSFSQRGELTASVGYLLARIRHIADDEGFTVNEKKTRVQRRHQQQSVTGLVVNDRMNVPRKTIRRLRAILHRAQREGFAAQNRDNHPHFEAWVRGMIAYISMSNPEAAQRLRTSFKKAAR